MIAPHAVPANEPRIQTLARIAVTPVFQTLAAPTGRLAEFGLAPPGVRLRLNDLLLELGTTDPIHFMRYVLLEGELRLINDGFQHHLLAPAEAFVSHQPLASERPIDRLVWQDRERRVTDVDAWTRLAAKKVEVAVPPYAGRTLTFHYGSGEGDRVFLVPEDHEGLLVRPDLGLAYRLADAGALRDLLGSGADPH